MTKKYNCAKVVARHEDCPLTNNIRSGMIRILDVHIHAVEDLRRIRVEDPDSYAAIFATLNLVRDDPDTIDKLTTHGDNLFGVTRLGVKRWETAQKKGHNLWRFRILDTAATVYRVVYGYNYKIRRVCVLAVVRKEEFNYDDITSGIAQRIHSDWVDL